MAVIRVNKTKDYTVMSNAHLKEKGMSLKAKGLLSLMLSLPEEWDYSIEGLCSICKEGETSISSTLDEIKQFGYLEVKKLMPNQTESGRIEYEYNIYEQPRQKQEGKKQGLENLCLEFQGLENQGQLNTNNKKTKNKVFNNSKNKSVCNINNSFKNIGKDTHALLQPIFEVLPDIIIDTETIPSNFNSQLVAEAISKSSKFLSNVKAVSFLIDHYNDIVKGKYDDYGKFKGTQSLVRRNYTKEQLNEMFPEIDNFDELDL